ncbi:MAG: hypothetical protein A2151_05200 [Candidatus Muproteobacteria bacterium RBG_16_65_34]|uniref:DUF4148 domain-containing protein n=1 Tax=Candidatus Muproteobacteria bacterium RBG_16_65_34 TaxID=1817760 RepID=A0A1F6TSE6_9PROT|nr:MAG: hypothetical protein A2151_05200 [Candidatus Muproteobacteria bacterium RBG_16_65_34]
MKPHTLYGILAGALLLGLGAPAWAWDINPPQGAQAQAQQTEPEQDRIYGRQMMTSEEITEYRNTMRAAKTAEERAKIRNEHHEKMVARAKERGVTLPEEPPARPGRMGPGGGMGPGRGMGGY